MDSTARLLYREISRMEGEPWNAAILRCPANWTRYGRRAGPLRNEHMADKAMLHSGGGHIILLAFPGGRGTAGMVEIAKYRQFEVIEVT